MSIGLTVSLPRPNHPDDDGRSRSLGEGRRGFRGKIVAVRTDETATEGVAARDLERRLLEMGFVEGARVEILHEGFIGRDPICVRVDDMRIAVRRHDVRGIRVEHEENP